MIMPAFHDGVGLAEYPFGQQKGPDMFLCAGR